jgi:hypothetical protein
MTVTLFMMASTFALSLTNISILAPDGHQHAWEELTPFSGGMLRFDRNWDGEFADQERTYPTVLARLAIGKPNKVLSMVDSVFAYDCSNQRSAMIEVASSFRADVPMTRNVPEKIVFDALPDPLEGSGKVIYLSVCETEKSR